MFCRECGAQLREDARFCYVCGASVAEHDAQQFGQSAELQAQSVKTDERARRLDAAAPESSRFAVAAGASGGASAGMSDSDRGSLKNAVDKTKTRSKRKIPLIVLVTLLLALASGVAYAAYVACSSMLASSPQVANETPEVEPAPVEYVIETKTVTVSTPDDPIMTPGKRADKVWEYPQVKASVENEAIDKINKAILDVVESSKEKVESTSAYERATTCDMRNISARIVKGVLVVGDSYQLQSWGAHGSYRNTGVAFDLGTGEQMTIAEAFGYSEEDLIDATVGSLQIWESKQNASNRSNPSKYVADWVAGYPANRSKYIGDFEKSLPFIANDEGIWYLPSDYELRGAYRGGKICVVDFADDDSLIGEESDYNPLR